MIRCKPILESGDFWVDPDHVCAVQECADHDGDFTCKIFLDCGYVLEAFDDDRHTSAAIRAWKENK